MARPKHIADLHEAKYELRFSDGSQKAAKRKAYLDALAEAARMSGLSGTEVEAAVAKDFAVWMRQEKLPKTSQK